MPYYPGYASGPDYDCYSDAGYGPDCPYDDHPSSPDYAYSSRACIRFLYYSSRALFDDMDLHPRTAPRSRQLHNPFAVWREQSNKYWPPSSRQFDKYWRPSSRQLTDPSTPGPINPTAQGSRTSDYQKKESYFSSGHAPLMVLESNWATFGARHSVAYMRYYKVEPVLQGRRPICAFAATAMAAPIVGRRANMEEMFRWASANQLTSSGGLDVTSVKKLCDKYLRVPVTVVDFPSEADMVLDLIKGNIFIVGYDATLDGEGTPGHFEGNNLHAALIFGAVLMRSGCTKDCCANLPKLSDKKPIYRCNLTSYLKHISDGDKFLMAYHGHHAKPNIWSYKKLCDSCAQSCRYSSSTIEHVRKNGLPKRVLKIELQLHKHFDVTWTSGCD